MFSQTVIGRMAYERPDDPVLFMRDQLQDMKEKGELPFSQNTTISKTDNASENKDDTVAEQELQSQGDDAS